MLCASPAVFGIVVPRVWRTEERSLTVAEIIGQTDIRMTRRYSDDMQEQKRQSLVRNVRYAFASLLGRLLDRNELIRESRLKSDDPRKRQKRSFSSQPLTWYPQLWISFQHSLFIFFRKIARGFHTAGDIVHFKHSSKPLLN